MRIRNICCITNLGTTPLVSSEVVMEWERRPFSLGNIILLKEKGGMIESVPRQVDRESRGPQGERGLKFSRRKKGQPFFLSPHSLGLYNNNVSCLRTVSGLSESEVAQLCPTLCDSMDCSLPGSSIHGIFQARILEWVATSSSRGSSWPRDWTWVSSVSYSGRQVLYTSTTWEAPAHW